MATGVIAACADKHARASGPPTPALGECAACSGHRAQPAAISQGRLVKRRAARGLCAAGGPAGARLRGRPHRPRTKHAGNHGCVACRLGPNHEDLTGVLPGLSISRC